MTTSGLVPGPNVVMKKQVGEKIAVTGQMIKGKREQREANESGTPVDNDYLRVTYVKKISGPCQ